MRRFLFSLAVVLATSVPALAHFGMIIPDKSIASQDAREVGLTLSFSHPFEMVGMDMAKPQAFTVTHEGKSTDLLAALRPAKVMDHAAWSASHAVSRPGMYVFAVTPEPYFEPAEDVYIQHITKTYVSAYGEGEGWEQPLGLPTEIVPLTRPWANYAGGVFQGQVLMDGKPVPHSIVEVEYYNKDKAYAAPSEAFVTLQVVADERGVFSVACPLPGWWGFAALNPGKEQIKGKDVELGAVLWTEMTAFKPAKKK